MIKSPRAPGPGGKRGRFSFPAISSAEAKKHFSDLLGRVAFGGETILILRHGKPVAKLVPPGAQGGERSLADVTGWLENNDPFFTSVEAIVSRRAANQPRALRIGRPSPRGSRRSRE